MPSPDTVQRGSSFTLAGTGLAPDTYVMVQPPYLPYGFEAMTDDTGAFVTELFVTDDAATGPTTFTVTQGTDEMTFAVTIT